MVLTLVLVWMGIGETNVRVVLVVGALAALFLLGPLAGMYLVFVPRRRPDGIYLRAFRSDRSNTRVKQALQALMGPGFRVAGIRDPRHRMPLFLRMLLLPVFLVRYAGERFMDLEAGRDWLARLWRTLGDARAAFIDVRDVTEGVLLEILVSHRSMGARRVLFLVDDAREPDAWRTFLAGELGLDTAAATDLQLAPWDPQDAEPPDAFVDAVAAFREQLPAERRGLDPYTWPLVASHAMGPVGRTFERVQGLFAVAAGLLLLVLADRESVFDFVPAAVSQALLAVGSAGQLSAWLMSLQTLLRLRRERRLARKLNQPYARRLTGRMWLLRALVLGPPVVLVAGLLAIVLPNVVRAVRHDDTRVARIQMQRIEFSIQMYYVRHRKMPQSLRRLTEPDARTGEPYMDTIPVDPWGNPYGFRLISSKQYQIVSFGEDGVEGTHDDIVWPEEGG